MKKLPIPESQMQEVLYELINRINIDRRSMMINCDVWNLTARISDLRIMGIGIKTTIHISTNRFNREIKTATYSLINKKDAIKHYTRMKTNQVGVDPV